MHGAVRVNRNKLLRVTGEAAAAELVGVAYARASKPTNTSAASCLGAGGHNYKGISSSAVLARLASGNSRHQGHDEDLQMAVKLRNCRSQARLSDGAGYARPCSSIVMRGNATNGLKRLIVPKQMKRNEAALFLFYSDETTLLLLGECPN